jgi:flagellar hook-length control protein FliK
VHLLPAAAPAAQTLQALVPPGAVIEARVLSLSVAAAGQAAYDMLLSIGSGVLKVTTAQPLAVGSHVQLTNDRGLRLQILPSAAARAKNDNPVAAKAASSMPAAPGRGTPVNNVAAAPMKHAVSVQQINTQIDQAMRSALPREQPIQPTLHAMQQLLNATDRPLPETSQQLLREVFARLPDLATVQNPQRLPDVLRHSGIFLENAVLQLAGNNARNTLGEDLRVALLRLAANLRARLPEGNAAVRAESGGRETLLLQQVQSVLARLKVHQLSSLNTRVHNSAETPAAPRVSLELPFLHGGQVESVQLTIGRESEQSQARKAPHQSAWTADLDFELGELGALHVRARLQDTQLSTVFWAPQKATLALVKRHIATLREELARHDVQLRHVAYQKGSPPARQLHPRPLLHVAI